MRSLRLSRNWQRRAFDNKNSIIRVASLYGALVLISDKARVGVEEVVG